MPVAIPDEPHGGERREGLSCRWVEEPASLRPHTDVEDVAGRRLPEMVVGRSGGSGESSADPGSAHEVGRSIRGCIYAATNAEYLRANRSLHCIVAESERAELGQGGEATQAGELLCKLHHGCSVP